jgi:diguanylate cyclase (GGDEF)-like protein/PAS domain S-box-containing protein
MDRSRLDIHFPGVGGIHTLLRGIAAPKADSPRSHRVNAISSFPSPGKAADSGFDPKERRSALRRFQDWWQQGDSVVQSAILNALPAHVAVLDGRGLIISVNEAWRRFESTQASHGPGPEVGRNYVDICDDASRASSVDAPQIAAGIRSVLAGGVKIFGTEYSCRSGTEQRWFMLTVTPLGSSPIGGALVIHQDVTARRTADEHLRSSEARFRQMAENIREVFFLIDASNHDILYVGPAYEEIWGQSSEHRDSAAAPWNQGVHPDDRRLIEGRYKAGLYVGKFNFEYRIIRPDGALRWIKMQGHPVLDGAGTRVRIAGTIEDITQRRHAAQDLLDGRQRLDNLVITAADAIVTVDEQQRIVLTNPAAELMFGYSAEELRDKPLTLLLAEPPDAAHSLDISQFHIDSDVSHPLAALLMATGLHKSGQTFQIEASLSRFEAGGAHYLTAMLRDTSERQRALNQLRESERRLSDMLSTIDLVSLMLDREGNIEYCNDYFLKLTGWSREEVLARNYFELFVPSEVREDSSATYSAMLNSPGLARHQDGTFLTRTGERRSIRWKNSVLRSNEGAVIGVASIGEDVTEQVRTSLQLKRLSELYEVLSRINALIVRLRDRDELFREACHIAVDAGAFTTAWIGEIDSQTLEGGVVAWHGAQDDFIRPIRLTAHTGQPESDRPACRALRQMQPIICNDVASDGAIGDSLRAELLIRGLKSAASFPLTVAGRPKAVLSLYATECNAFGDVETRLLMELAGNISFALDHVENRDRLDYLSYYDELTGLANRSLFLERVGLYIRGAASDGGKLALGLIDLERFKNINYSLGRSAGDALLRQVAQWLIDNLGDATHLARIGGNQFAVIFPKIKPEFDLGRLLEQTMEAFRRHPFHLNDAEFHIGAKIGVALYPEDGADYDTLYKNSEAALRKAKMSGDAYLFYAQRMTDTVVVRLGLENRLREAIEKEQFVLHYQPKFNLASGKVTGAEALLRWNDPRAGLTQPDKFIPILEETGLIHEVGRWALDKAIEDYLQWRAGGWTAIRIAVNVSALQLRSRAFIDEIRRSVAVDLQGPCALELEITESLIMEDVKHSSQSLREIRAMGVTVAIDDFGTGFSSLSYLAKLPLDTLKIDRSFVNDMTTGEQSRVLVATIINLAHSLKLNVVAEGVETEEESQQLKTLSCDEAQGYLLGKPAPRDSFEMLYLAGNPATNPAQGH